MLEGKIRVSPFLKVQSVKITVGNSDTCFEGKNGKMWEWLVVHFIISKNQLQGKWSIDSASNINLPMIPFLYNSHYTLSCLPQIKYSGILI